jgi:hypothetical protein
MSYEIKVDFSIRDWESITRESINRMSQAIRDRGRQNIASAGRFSDRWTQGLKVATRQRPNRGYSVTVRLSKPNFAKVFEYGATSIAGTRGGQKMGRFVRTRGGRVRARSQLLWIPVASDSRGVRVQNYGSQLFRPGRPDNPKNVLMAVKDREVKYVGVRSVRIKPRFNIRKISEEEANKFFSHMMASGGS